MGHKSQLGDKRMVYNFLIVGADKKDNLTEELNSRSDLRNQEVEYNLVIIEAIYKSLLVDQCSDSHSCPLQNQKR